MSIPQRFKDDRRLGMLLLLTIVWTLSGVSGDIYVKDLSSNITVSKFPDMQASFGPDFPMEGLQGWLVYASPDHTACGHIDGPPINETKCNETYCNYILLIARGGSCEFADKVYRYMVHCVCSYFIDQTAVTQTHAVDVRWILVSIFHLTHNDMDTHKDYISVLAANKYGYDAAIIHNLPGKNSTVEMQSCSNGSRVNIPSTFVGYTDGMELWHYNYTHKKYVIKIIEDDEDLRLFLWPFAVVVGVCFLIFVVFMLVKFLREHASKKLNRLSRKHLKKIPVRKFKKGDYYDTCAICLDEYEEGEKIRVLPCDHVYHMKCIDPWLTKNKKTCPVCKRRVIPGRDADSESDSEAEEGQATTGGSENTPLLGGGSRPQHGQSHGSTDDSVLLVNPSDSVVQSQGNTTSPTNGSTINPPDSEPEHGAVGGEGISDRNHISQTLLSLAGPSREGDERTELSSERKQKRKDLSSPTEDDDTTAMLLGSETRAERRERRKLRKDRKKKGERRHRRDEASQGSQERVNEAEEEVSSAKPGAAEMDDVRVRVGGEGEYDNPSYSESHEVVGPSRRHEMNNVV